MVGIPGFGAPWSVLAAWMAEVGMAEDLAEARWQSLLMNVNMRELTRLMSDAAKLEEMQGQFTHVNEVLGRFYARYPKQYLYEEGQRRRLLIGAVNTPQDLAENKQLNARGWFQHVDHPELDDTLIYPGPPYRLGASPWRIGRRPPLIGEHNAEIWGRELGVGDDEMTALAGAGAI
jgi:crotonobetainyl-CoA:carnitine CoA-transferase CaiB-like acyl-CoA transferase